MSNFLNTFIAIGAVWVLGAMPAFGQGLGRLPWEDYEKLIKAKQSIVALSAENAFGDHFDLYSGTLSFSATDISISGNFSIPVSVSRKFTVTDRSKHPFTRDYAFADWDLDLPRLSGTFAPDWHNNRCTGAAPPTVESAINPSDYWGGNTADMPGGEMLRADVSRPKPANGADYTWVTAGDTYFSCLPSITNGTGEGFLAITKEGNKYWFNHMAQYKEPRISIPRGKAGCGTATPARTPSTTNSKPVDGATGTNLGPNGIDLAPALIQREPCITYASAERRRNVLYPTRVEDRFGNSVIYTYTNAFNQPVRISQISSSDGRTISFQYNASGYIGSVSDGARTWTYQYNGDSLSRVNLPDSSNWSMDFAALSDAEIQYSEGDAGFRRCTTPNSWISGNFTGVIHAPSGAKGTFTVGPTNVGRTNVPLICSTWSPPSSPGRNDADDFPILPYRWSVLSLKQRVVEGPGLAPAVWNYDLSSGSGWVYPIGQTTPVCQSLNCLDPVCVSDSCAGANRSTQIAEPDGTTRLFVFGNSYRYNEGKLLRESVRTTTGSVLRLTTNTYNFATSGQPYSPRIGTSPQARGDGFTSEYPRPLIRKVTNQQGVDFNWAVDTGCAAAGQICMDSLMRPSRVVLWSSIPGSVPRTESHDYHDNLSLWVMGQLSRVAVGSLVPQARSFDPTFALPLVETAFGAVQRSLNWDTTSTIASGQRGTLRSVADGNSNTTTLSSWHRGVPGLVSHPDLTSQSALVSQQGWIAQVNDENNIATKYGYDALGRINRVDFPAGHPTVYGFLQAGDNAFGLPAGHWRHTSATGNAITVRYLDGLWRERVRHTYDAASPGDTKSFVETRYDHGGRKTFVSYPQRNFGVVGEARPGTYFEYDALGRVLREVKDTELGQTERLTQYIAPFQRQVRNERGFWTTYAFQAFDEPREDSVRSVSMPEDAAIDIQRDVFGKPTAITRSGPSGGSGPTSVTRSYGYDAHQRLCKTVEPESGATVQAHDAAGNVAWRASGLVDAGNACGSAPDNRKINLGYDSRNRLTSTSFGDGQPGITRSYTPDGLLRQIISSSFTWTYAYNSRRLLEQEQFSVPGQAPGAGWNFTHGIDDHGNVSSLADPWGTMNYSPNALGQPTQVSGYASGVSYHANGAVAGYTLANGVTRSVGLNARGLPAQWQDAGVLSDTYTYDANGNVTGIQDVLQGVNTRSMGYDGLDRLKEANGPWGNGVFRYDALDNLTYSQLGGRTLNHNIDAATNRLGSLSGSQSVAMGYDANGNLASRGGQGYTFDIANRMRLAQGKATYDYDGHGRRSWVVFADGSTQLNAYSGTGSAGKLRFSGHSVKGNTRYVYLGDKLIAEVNSQTGTSFSHTDALGSPVARTNSAGTVTERTRYEPYGATVAGSANPASIGFTGHVNDADTGLVYMQQRYYDPVAGRFLSVDPVTTDANTGSSFNRYVYGNNNPFKFKDPDGRFAETAWDVASLVLSVNEFRNNPSIGNAIGVAVDAAAVALPGVPGGVGAIRAMGHAAEAGKNVASSAVQGVNRTYAKAIETDGLRST